jgi:hypothetical protein
LADVYTAENALMLLTKFTPRELHLLFRSLVVIQPWEGSEVIPSEGLLDRWKELCRAGLEMEEPLCDYACINDGPRRTFFRELGIHGAWNWRNADHVQYIVLEGDGLRHGDEGKNLEHYFGGEGDRIYSRRELVQ